MASPLCCTSPDKLSGKACHVDLRSITTAAALPFARLIVLSSILSVVACGSGDSGSEASGGLESLGAGDGTSVTDSSSGNAVSANSDDNNTTTSPIVFDNSIFGSVSTADFFGKSLEVDLEEPVAGGPPTQPKNLHVNLLGNDWVELDWAPSNDDGQVVAYRIYRNDGVVYTVETTEGNAAVQSSRTLRDYWQTTTFIDCNFTHVRACDQPGFTPAVGSTHSYTVTAVDDAGNESQRSQSVEVSLHPEQGGRIAKFADPYIDSNDNFQFQTDLSNTANFIDQFELIWSDEFDQDTLDDTKWTTSLTWRQEDQNIINGEMQYFVDTQTNPDFGYNPFILNGETLTISAIRTPPELIDKALGQPFLSGALSTHELRSGQNDSNGNLIADKFGTTYGYVEGRLRVGQKSGMLTSFYLFRRWAAEHSPEIDIIEYLGDNPFGDEKAFQTYHYRDVTHQNTLSTPTMVYPREGGALAERQDLAGFHNYSVLWEPNLVIWYINGREIQRLTGPQISRQSMNVILYLVTGSAWAPRPADDANFPFEIEIDYVRAYKRKPWQGG